MAWKCIKNPPQGCIAHNTCLMKPFISRKHCGQTPMLPLVSTMHMNDSLMTFFAFLRLIKGV